MTLGVKHGRAKALKLETFYGTRLCLVVRIPFGFIIISSPKADTYLLSPPYGEDGEIAWSCLSTIFLVSRF